ncbi:hypothetical protein MOKP101_38730 [Mycobacterium avium subsp. hominissuis]
MDSGKRTKSAKQHLNSTEQMTAHPQISKRSNGLIFAGAAPDWHSRTAAEARDFLGTGSAASLAEQSRKDSRWAGN